MNVRRQERALVRRMIDGDEAAFEEFSELYIPGLYRFATNRLHGDREVTADVVQSTLCKAIAKIASFRGEAALMTWLCACCRNEIAGHFRRQQRTSGHLDFQVVEEAMPALLAEEQPESPESDVLRRETSHQVHVALDALPPHYGQALEWKYLENLSVKEIAGRLNLGVKAVESLLTRARQSFRDGYAKLAADPQVWDMNARVSARRIGVES